MSSDGRGRRRRRMPKPKETSFIEHMQTDHGALAQERVIRDLRATVRSIETERPYTPADRSRGLFGVSGVGERHRSRTASANSLQRSVEPRPPSAFSIGRKQFLANLPETDDLDRPTTGVRPSYRRYPQGMAASSVSRHASADADMRRRCASTSSTSRSASRRRLPSGSDEHTNDPDIPAAKQSSHRRMMPRPPPRPPQPPGRSGQTMDTTEEAAGTSSASTPTSATGHTASSASSSSATAAATTPAGGKPGSMRVQPRPPTRPGESAAARRASSADQVPRVASAVAEDNTRWQQLEPLITKLSVGLPVDQLLSIVSQITEFLSTKPLYHGQRNSEVLRSLYRLTDLSDPRLLARVGRLILMITRKGTVKNVCKMLFKLSRNEANDGLLKEENIPDVLVGVLDACNRQEHAEGLVYCCGAIKNLSNAAEAQQYFVQRGVLPVMNRHLRDIIRHLPQAGTQMSSYTGHMLVQLTAALRNLAVNPQHLPAFEESELIQSLCTLVELFPADKDLVLNVMRIFSKVTAMPAGRAAVGQVANVVAHLVKIAERHAARKTLCVRTYFVLGNLTTDDPQLRTELFEATNRGSTLLDCLTRRGRELVEALQAEAPRTGEGADADVDGTASTRANGNDDDDDDDDDDEDNGQAAPGSNGSKNKISDVEDLVVKVVRVLGNMCITPEYGAHIASDQRLSLLLDVCRTDAVTTGHRVLLMSVVGCVNNMSYYQVEENFVLSHRLDFAQTLAPCLLSPSMELVVEVARVFGNFSQHKEIRQLLVDTRVDELLVVLLEHTNREVVYTVCGILMNLLGDAEFRHVMQKNDHSGVDALVDVVAGSAGEDWQIAGLACKTLWNYCERLGQPEGADLMPREQMQDLLDVLADVLDEEAVPQDDEDAVEFGQVAEHLRRHVSECLNPFEPL